jgi:hypothetical protein
MGQNARFEENGIQLGGTVKCSGAVLDLSTLSVGGPKKANEEKGTGNTKHFGYLWKPVMVCIHDDPTGLCSFIRAS